MIIKKVKIPVELHYLCDDCKVEVETTDIVLMSDPPRYVHKCPKCGKEYHLDQVFSCIVYEDKTITHDMFGGFNF